MSVQKTGSGRRAERLRAALRENLKRRKLKAKGKPNEAVAPDGPQTHNLAASRNSAEFAPDEPRD
jgi:hypothetical protein